MEKPASGPLRTVIQARDSIGIDGIGERVRFWMNSEGELQNVLRN